MKIVIEIENRPETMPIAEHMQKVMNLFAGIENLTIEHKEISKKPYIAGK
jgi:hypothetical protein